MKTNEMIVKEITIEINKQLCRLDAIEDVIEMLGQIVIGTFRAAKLDAKQVELILSAIQLECNIKKYKS